MRTPLALIGVLALAGAGLALAAAAPQEAAPQPAQAQPPAAQPAAAEPAAATFTPEQKSVVDAISAFAKAYTAGDAKELANCFTDDLVLIDPEGTETRGKADVVAMYNTAFQDYPGLKLDAQIAEVRFITADVARVEGQSRLTSDGDAADFSRFSTLMVRKNGKWQAAEIREFTAPAEDITPYERLQELEWMVGRWVEEDGAHKVQAEIKWADNHSYLVRTYKAEVQGETPTSGTMFIGWDPQSGQLKSWNFDSEGGRGEGLWTRSSEVEWVVKAQGVTRDGRPNSSTLIHTIVNRDTVKTSSIDRIIGGQLAPDIMDVVMVKQPPAPAGASPAPAASTAPAPAAAPGAR